MTTPWHAAQCILLYSPSESAGSVNFQTYLLEGIARWNADRHAEAVGDKEMSCYNQKLQSAVVRVTTSVGAKLGMTVRRPEHRYEVSTGTCGWMDG